MSDPGTSYRTRAEIQEVRQNRDPITSFREKILTADLVTPEELKVGGEFGCGRWGTREGVRGDEGIRRVRVGSRKSG